MCGICGFVDHVDRAGSPRLLQAMAQAIRHRGPDATGYYVDAEHGFGLASTRLAVLDIPGGSQPMCSADGRYVLVFNGEIYNFKILRRELQTAGVVFHTRSDTEVLLCGFQHWGRDCLRRLDGMFAFAILDKREETLFLARDRVGIKPLYYNQVDKGFFFASELKALLAAGAPRRVFTPALIDHFVLGYPTDSATFFHGIRELQPGSWLEISPAGLRSGRYWTWQGRSKSERPCDLDRLESVLVDSLQEHLVADVPVGAFLSGGIDSSLLVALITRYLRSDLHTFTVQFSDGAFDESAAARTVAESTRTLHHWLQVESARCDFETVEKVIDHFDQPFGDSSAVPTYLLCREIRRHLKVVIAGDGGDEMFGGYRRFRYADAARWVGSAPKWLRNAGAKVARATERLHPERSRQMQRLFRAATLQGSDRLVELFCYHSPSHLSSVLRPEVLARSPGYWPMLPTGNQNGCGGSEFMHATVSTALPGDYLRKIDMMSSAHGLEVRVPFLSSRIMEFSATLAPEDKYSWRENKIPLRRLAARNLPLAIAKKRKQGFSIPLDTYLGDQGRERVRQQLCDPGSRIRDYVLPEYSDALLDRFVRGTWDHSKMSRWTLYQRVYLLWTLERWLQKWQPAAA